MSQMSSCFCLVFLSVKYLNKNIELFNVIEKKNQIVQWFQILYCALGCYR